jgi:two-component sensor histidine kinase
LQLKIDTAVGDFVAAFGHLNDYKNLSDSINTTEKDRVLADVLIKYETEKKDKELLLRQQSIDVLTNRQQIQDIQLSRAALQAQLEKQQRLEQERLNLLEAERQSKDLQLARYQAERKDSRISLLNKQSQIQKANLEKNRIVIYVSVSGLLLTLIIMVLLLRSYQLKKRNNKQLNAQKLQIDIKNIKLQKLVQEKEWLLKEVHHRVKNNLQIVMSLLSSQSVYVADRPAQNAILDSQHRVHAMALIHQKLYNDENVSSIDISNYIRELVSNLSESFNVAHSIHFSIDVEKIRMDVSQAVPLGLILNEAITNSIKYAFKGREPGKISISFLLCDESRCQLTVSDNGVGIPSELIAGKSGGSLGMSLLAGLSEELDGTLCIENTTGTSVKVDFPYDTHLKSSEQSLATILSN